MVPACLRRKLHPWPWGRFFPLILFLPFLLLPIPHSPVNFIPCIIYVAGNWQSLALRGTLKVTVLPCPPLQEERRIPCPPQCCRSWSLANPGCKTSEVWVLFPVESLIPQTCQDRASFSISSYNRSVMSAFSLDIINKDHVFYTAN